MCQIIRITDPEPWLWGRSEMAEILHENQDCFQRQGEPVEVSEPGAKTEETSSPTFKAFPFHAAFFQFGR